MPPRRSARRGRGRGRGAGRIPREEASVHVEAQDENQNAGVAGNPPGIQNLLARDIVAALAAANLLHPPQPQPQTATGDRAIYAMREFRRLNPPQFNGEGGDFLAANHWLAEIRKLFNALKITEDDLRVNIVACQLVGEANEWWESILAARKDARRAARTAAQADTPDVEDLTWAEFERLFESQYFPDSYRELLREQFERLEQGTMTISEYAAKFQSLSRHAPELVTTEDRKCRRFERGLHSSVKRLVISQHKMDFAEIVECARSVEIPRDASKGAKVWEPRQTSANVSSSTGSFGSQGRKRAREPYQASQNRSNSKPSPTTASYGTTARPDIICHRCNQPGHIRAQCPLPVRNCFTCGKEDHIARNCPRGAGARSESGSVQQQRFGQGSQSQRGGASRQQQPHYRQTTSVQGSQAEKGASSSTPTQGSVPMGSDAREQGAQGRVYNILSAVTPSTSPALDASVVRGTFLLFNSLARVLFDSGASHSFIAASFVCALELETDTLQSPLYVETPIGVKHR